MSLFPAYGNAATSSNAGQQHDKDDAEYLGSDGGSSGGVSPARESALLAESPAAPSPRSAVAQKTDNEDFFVDCKMEFGYLGVSTLYYPARPEYKPCDRRRTLGALGGSAPRRRARRYWARAQHVPPTDDASDAEARALAYRRALSDDPHDEDLWLRYIDFQERCATAAGGVAGGEAPGAAERAAAACPRSWRLRAALHAALRRALSPEAYLARLRDMLAATKGPPEQRLELWARLVSGVACAGGPDCAGGVSAAAAAAARDLRHHPLAYPDLIYVYGAFLRSGGLWEQLVQLIELLIAMNFPPAPFPPPRDAPRDAQCESQLREYEDKVIASGLPLSEVWARVERARDALQWRAPAVEPPPRELAADPQRVPHAHDLADLLLPATEARASFRLLVVLLRLADAPLLPAAQFAQRALCPAGADLAASWEATGARSLVALLRAARRLPPAHALRQALAPPRAAQRLLHAAPHRAFALDDSTGFDAWAAALWDAALHWTADRRRVALLCWRLRLLHARLLLIDSTDEAGGAAVRRLRGEARDALRRWAGDAAVPFAVFARLEAAAGGPARGLQAALQAVRAACRDADAPHVDALFAARVAWELAAGGAEGVWALSCAALRQALPPAAALRAPPPAELVAAALERCERCCEEEERAQREGAAAEGAEDAALSALLPAAAEWAAARALLASPLRRRELLLHLLDFRDPTPEASGAARRERYCEQSACALTAAAAGDARAARVARSFAHRFPLNAFLALMSSGEPPWMRTDALAMAPRGELPALAALLPPLLRALIADWPPREAERVERVARRVADEGGPAGGAMLGALRLEAAARAAGGAQAQHALLAALYRAPHHKWLHVRGAALLGGAGEAGALPDLLLDKQLRLRALPDELHPAPPAARIASLDK